MVRILEASSESLRQGGAAVELNAAKTAAHPVRRLEVVEGEAVHTNGNGNGNGSNGSGGDRKTVTLPVPNGVARAEERIAL